MITQTTPDTIALTAVSLSAKNYTIIHKLTLSIPIGKSLAITGVSGSGKTSLAKLIAGLIKPTSGEVNNPLKTVFVSQQDHFSEIAGMASTYYSKRYEFHDYENPMTVPSYLQQLLKNKGLEHRKVEDIELLDVFNVRYLLNRNLMQLSNGERKRLQLVSAFLPAPEVLIMDQPFTGLDVTSRAQLSEQLKRMEEHGVTLLMICGRDEIPEFVSGAILLKDGRVEKHGTPSEVKETDGVVQRINTDVDVDSLLQENPEKFNTIIRMRNVNVQMKGNEILKNIDWEVKPGECWSLLGHNGAGKSTLLSLVTADNPQGYNNDLILFDKQRGSGESIWDIKKRIGFLSPELHLYFMRGKGILNSVPGITTDAKPYSTLTCTDVIISGYQDEIGTVSPPTPHQESIALQWLQMVDLLRLKDTLFVDASLGEQRVLLLLRALIKVPALLILDEPCQGMDGEQIHYFKRLLNHICRSKQITMVYVSHRKDEIPDCVDKVIMLENGSVVENGTRT